MEPEDSISFPKENASIATQLEYICCKPRPSPSDKIYYNFCCKHVDNALVDKAPVLKKNKNTCLTM